jgi:uracil phosphoribosyltransferase
MSPISSNVHISSHPIVVTKLSVLRDKNSSSKVFRDVMTDLSVLLGYEATQDLELKATETVKEMVILMY